MVISEYIASGILEQYVMGTATPQERQEVECMSKIYPELREELTKLEQAMEAYAMTLAVEPPPALKASIFQAIDNQPAAAPVQPETPKHEAKVVALQPSNRMRYLAAASVVGLLLMAGAWWVSHNQQAAQMASLEEKVRNTETELSVRRDEVAVLSNPDNTIVKLSGVATKSPTSSMQVYWNKKTKDLYISQLNLPAAPPDKQYQLWALAGGKPIDMGVFDVMSDGTALLKMKNAQDAQAFAVTLEPKGGSQNPTLTEMYVIGNI